jgi:hypothetical protein
MLRSIEIKNRIRNKSNFVMLVKNKYKWITFFHTFASVIGDSNLFFLEPIYPNF